MSKNFLDSNVYFGLSKVYLFKNITIILVEIVRMTLDAFWSENRPFVSETFHRSRRGFAPESNIAVIGRRLRLSGYKFG